MRENSRKIYVYENWSKDIPVKMGTLYADGNRGKEVYSFEYDISLILYFFYGSFRNASFFLFILRSVRPQYAQIPKKKTPVISAGVFLFRKL